MKPCKWLLGVLFLLLYGTPALAGPLLPNTLGPNTAAAPQTKEVTSPDTGTQTKGTVPASKPVSKKHTKKKTLTTTEVQQKEPTSTPSAQTPKPTSPVSNEVDSLLSSPEAKRIYQQNLSLLQAQKEVELLKTQKEAAELKKQIRDFQKVETPAPPPPPSLFPGMGTSSGNSFYPPVLQEGPQSTNQGGFRVVMSTGEKALLEKDGQYFFCKEGDTVSGWETVEVNFEGVRFKNKDEVVYVPVTFSPAPEKQKEASSTVSPPAK